MPATAASSREGTATLLSSMPRRCWTPQSFCWSASAGTRSFLPACPAAHSPAEKAADCPILPVGLNGRPLVLFAAVLMMLGIYIAQNGFC